MTQIQRQYNANQHFYQLKQSQKSNGIEKMDRVNRPYWKFDNNKNYSTKNHRKANFNSKSVLDFQHRSSFMLTPTWNSITADVQSKLVDRK